MSKTLLGRKIRMTHMFDESGAVIPLTALQVGPCPVVQVKTDDGDGYSAYQIGYGDIREKKVHQAKKGHFKRSGSTPTRYRSPRQNLKKTA